MSKTYRPGIVDDYRQSELEYETPAEREAREKTSGKIKLNWSGYKIPHSTRFNLDGKYGGNKR
jgi:hypothetical protein